MPLSTLSASFAGTPARDLLAAAVREERAPEGRELRGLLAFKQPDAPGLVGELAAASDEEHERLTGKGLTLSLKEVWISDIHESIFGGTGEVYVLTSVIDGTGSEPQFQTKEFTGVSWGERLHLGDGGMLVGSVADPRWFFDFHMLIMESDSGARDLGKAIAEVRESSGLNDAIKLAGGLAKFDPTGITTITTAVGLFLSMLSATLRRNGDDVIATVHDFYLAAQGFGVGRHPAAETEKWGGARLAYQIDVTDM
jgi:hypothetical protein